jgi:uncharacterized integral membrane protein
MIERYQRPSANGSIIYSLIFVGFLLLVILGSCAIVATGAASMVDSTTTNGASVVNTWTQESGLTSRTRIEWNGRVRIEEIRADATKKTDFTFLLFYLSRFLIFVGVIVAAIGGALWVLGKRGGANA